MCIEGIIGHCICSRPWSDSLRCDRRKRWLDSSTKSNICNLCKNFQVQLQQIWLWAFSSQLVKSCGYLPKLVCFATLSAWLYRYHCWSTTLAQTEISQQLWHESLWNFVRGAQRIYLNDFGEPPRPPDIGIQCKVFHQLDQWLWNLLQIFKVPRITWLTLVIPRPFI